MAEIRRTSRRSKPALGLDDYVSSEHMPAELLSRHQKRPKLDESYPTIRLQNHAVPPSLASATLLHISKTTVEREKQRMATQKASLTNPVPRQEQNPVHQNLNNKNSEQLPDPKRRAELYMDAMKKLGNTLADLQKKITRYNGVITVTELEDLHDEFGKFMKWHPLYGIAPWHGCGTTPVAVAEFAKPTIPQKYAEKPGNKPLEEGFARGVPAFNNNGSLVNPMTNQVWQNASPVPVVNPKAQVPVATCLPNAYQASMPMHQNQYAEPTQAAVPGVTNFPPGRMEAAHQENTVIDESHTAFNMLCLLSIANMLKEVTWPPVGFPAAPTDE